ncbi:hypothetical protein NDU88_005669 [Pleurodeles waltl]|uniref:Uncharacterized protein n=1 Tax=Pleurodeles waltl TaxID=8319 RepID=A0AAV7TCW9_PLEWA|nr:hypothetical protein NDU88_005669 [Pleurodeles waltl]
MNRTRALYISGAGLVAPPAERAPLILVRARPGRRRRAARSVWDPGGSGPRGATTPLSPSRAAPPRATSFLIRSTGAPRSGPRDLDHPPVCRLQILTVPTPPSCGRKQPQLLQARRGGKAPLTATSAAAGDPPQPGVPGGFPPRRGPAPGAAPLPALFRPPRAPESDPREPGSTQAVPTPRLGTRRIS